VERDSIDRIIDRWAERDPEVDARPLEVVGRLLLCSHYCRQALMNALDPFGLSFGDFDVINTLRRRGDAKGTNPSELAASSLITTGAMTARLDRLERAGLIKRTPDMADGRAIRIRLTARGTRVAKRALAAVIAADYAFLEPLDERQRRSIALALKRLLLSHETVEEPPVESGG
jgi:DNA-binding MarR family transcriptional regulator